MRKRSKQVLFRLTEAEYRHLARQAQVAGLRIAPYLRALVLGSELKPKPPDEWPELVRQVSGIGRNINQIARLANAGGRVDPAAVDEVRGLQADIWQRVKNL